MTSERNTTTFCLEDGDDKPVDFNGKAVNLSSQQMKIFIKLELNVTFTIVSFFNFHLGATIKN